MQIPRMARKTNNWVLEQIKLELSLETKMLKLRLRLGTSREGKILCEKITMLGKFVGSRKEDDRTQGGVTP